MNAISRRCLVALALITAGCGVKAPETYKVKLETSKGDVMIEVTRAWSPRGADRFYELVKSGFYDNARFFRMLPRFVVQFGLSGDPAMNSKWSGDQIPDDPPAGHSNAPGTITFAMAGPNTRTSQVFINMGNNANLDPQGFTPFGRVTSGMDTVSQFFAGYGEMAPQGAGPDPGLIQAQGNAYLERQFPQLDYIKKASIVE